MRGQNKRARAVGQTYKNVTRVRKRERACGLERSRKAPVRLLEDQAGLRCHHVKF